jgi:hypothetical protein
MLLNRSRLDGSVRARSFAATPDVRLASERLPMGGHRRAQFIGAVGTATPKARVERSFVSAATRSDRSRVETADPEGRRLFFALTFGEMHDLDGSVAGVDVPS